MTSMNTNMEAHLDEQPPAKKPRIDDMNADEQKEELETSTTTTVDLPRGHLKLPPELNCQIFYCLNLATRFKFICGLGWDFYAMFRQKLLIKTKRVRNPFGNRFNGANTIATVAADGLSVSNYTDEFSNVFAVHPFPSSGPHCRIDDYPGTILYYYEVKGRPFYVGLSDAIIDLWMGEDSNSYAISSRRLFDLCWLAGEEYRFELPEGAIRPEEKQFGNVFGCGLVLDTQDKLAIFFTLNGKLLGRKIPIRPTVDRLFPAVKMMPNKSLEANFGDDPAKPFEYDIHNCPGLELALAFI